MPSNRSRGYGEGEVDIHFDCVFYYVKDLEKSVRFYSDVLGLDLTSRDVVARFDVDGVLLELVPALDDSVLHGSGNARFCLKVSDIREAVGELRAEGVFVGEIQTLENGMLAAFRDPDGNELALWQYR